MPRGGKRQGTPGKGYANRTDLTSNYDQAEMTAGTGGMEAPPMAAPPVTPDDSPMLSDPTMRPDEPVTAGLPIGPGSGPRADPRIQETQQLKKYLPLIGLYLDQPETPNSVRLLFRYIRGS
jgi:hypothetical protein